MKVVLDLLEKLSSLSLPSIFHRIWAGGLGEGKRSREKRQGRAVKQKSPKSRLITFIFYYLFL